MTTLADLSLEILADAYYFMDIVTKLKLKATAKGFKLLIDNIDKNLESRYKSFESKALNTLNNISYRCRFSLENPLKIFLGHVKTIQALIECDKILLRYRDRTHNLDRIYFKLKNQDQMFMLYFDDKFYDAKEFLEQIVWGKMKEFEIWYKNRYSHRAFHTWLRDLFENPKPFLDKLNEIMKLGRAKGLTTVYNFSKDKRSYFTKMEYALEAIKKELNARRRVTIDGMNVMGPDSNPIVREAEGELEFDRGRKSWF
jgi:hypothetical protein